MDEGMNVKLGDRRKYYNCSKCRYRTDRKNNLKRHLLTMHEKCSKRLECCNLIFLNKSALKDHVSEFHAGSGYACLVCNRKFSRKALMKRHSMVHTGRREFNCRDCDYATSHKSNLDRHVNRHRPSFDDTSVWFGHVFSVCNDFLTSSNLYREKDETVVERIQHFDRLRSNYRLHHPFYQQLIHSNLEYIRYFYKLYNFDNSLVLLKGGTKSCEEDSGRNPFIHRKGFPWLFSACQMCQHDSHFKLCYENKEMQQFYFLTWMNMMKSLTARQVIWSEGHETFDLWSKTSKEEKEFKFTEEDQDDSILFNRFQNGRKIASECFENSVELLDSFIEEAQNTDKTLYSPSFPSHV